jgi:hypothetical protein
MLERTAAVIARKKVARGRSCTLTDRVIVALRHVCFEVIADVLPVMKHQVQLLVVVNDKVTHVRLRDRATLSAGQEEKCTLMHAAPAW